MAQFSISANYHAFLDLLFLLLSEGLRDAGVTRLRAQQQLPQLAHEQPSVLPVQESRQIDLHFFWTGELGRRGDGSGKKKRTHY